MKVKINKLMVDVADAQCKTRSCFVLGFDKGSFTRGRGYTSYHRDGDRPVCMKRHLYGCPTPTICPQCRTLQVEGVTTCCHCKVAVVPRTDVTP